MSIDHNNLLKKLVKDELKSLGIIQKGNSRTFLFDKGWATIIIEFQPSSHSKGTYLNVGIDFNFYPRDYFVFSFGYREKDFVPMEDEKQFSQLCLELCDHAKKRVNELNELFFNPKKGCKTLRKTKSKDSWQLLDISILQILTGRKNMARKNLDLLSNRICKYEYEFKRKRIVDKLILNSPSNDDLLKNTELLILEARRQKKLPELSIEQILRDSKD